MFNVLKKVIGTKNDRIVKSMQPTARKIGEYSDSYEKLSDDDLKAKTPALKERIERGESLDQILPEAFAAVREAGRRVLGMRHYDVQLIGGMVLHQGNIAEMKTGEGKTLTATLPMYLHALTGKGAHLVTVNDYLATRDAEWMGQLYNYLGLSVGVIKHGLSDTERREAYHSDITYGTNNEFGFDFLRDNMKVDVNRLVQREYNFAIVDEVDSILVDEARTPLIISGPAESNLSLYGVANSAVIGLQKDSDYLIDEKSRNVSLTEDGINKLEKRLRVDNLYEPSNIDLLHHANQSLKAHVLFKKDVDYVVKGGDVMIVDEHTGRLMPGRRYSDGLHGALEAKEHVPVQNETQTLATITFQNFFRMYNVLSGMTGTADTEAVEFKKIYNLDVVVIPTNKPITRIDHPDIVFRTAREKFNALADEIAEAQKKGQPVLVGTVSVEKSELVAALLKKRNIPHEILNAKNHGREANIIADSGKSGHVTISTNMAGRGTDIVLGEGVKEKGGLLVVATERHESRRIDNQLRGRSGRQGDPGTTKFYLSLEDDLMRIFAPDSLSGLMQRMGMTEGESIVSPMVTRAIERAQKRVEEQNFSSRKHLLEYDDVMNQQRQVVYSRRRSALEEKGDVNFLQPTLEEIAFSIASRNSPENSDQAQWDFEKVSQEVSGEFQASVQFENFDKTETSSEAVSQHLAEKLFEHYEKKMDSVPSEIRRKIESYIFLQVIDQSWKDHLLAMDALKDSVNLRGYAQRNPLQEYKKEAFNMFESMWIRIQEEVTLSLIKMPPPQPTSEQSLQHNSVSEDEMNFQHPNAKSMEDGAVPPAEKDQLIYHGSRSAPTKNQEDTEARPETYKRQLAKVGRNDPCPCGSTKKFKKCHGAAGANLDELDNLPEEVHP